MPEQTYGELAYLGYRTEFGWQDLDGTMGAHWSELSEKCRVAWEMAAEKVLTAYGERTEPAPRPVVVPLRPVPVPVPTPSTVSSTKADRKD